MQNKTVQYKMEIDLDNVLIDEKSHKNILIYDILHKTLIGSNLCKLDSIK